MNVDVLLDSGARKSASIAHQGISSFFRIEIHLFQSQGLTFQVPGQDVLYHKDVHPPIFAPGQKSNFFCAYSRMQAPPPFME
jgi:hypothetical protein